MSYRRILVNRANLPEATLETESLPDIGPGEVLVEVERFALSANNVSYADAGDMLGYWNFFPASDGFGCVPVWGFGRIVASTVEDLTVGEQIFGYFPMASHLVMSPSAIEQSHFADHTAHRQPLHPWYNRYYRCAHDPLYAESSSDLQPALWALHMTGWMMADHVSEDVQRVVVSSASSKTALSLAWSLQRQRPATEVVGLTSERNLGFVEARGVYDRVLSYEEVPRLAEGTPDTTYIDIAGNPEVTSNVHVALQDSLIASVTIGATHRAQAADPLPMPGPGPTFFFIPDVAEARAERDSFEAYHLAFAEAWKAFADWSNAWLRVESDVGDQAILDAYQRLLSGNLPPDQALSFTWA